MVEIFWTKDYAQRALQPQDGLHAWAKKQSCMYSPENEDSHRPTALSDCIPGFLLVHIICMQRHIVNNNPERAMDFATELMRLYPFGAHCMDKANWPITSQDVLGYYRRFRRTFQAGPKRWLFLDAAGRRELADLREEGMEPEEYKTGHWPVHLLREMLWQASPNSPASTAARVADDSSDVESETPIGDGPDICPQGTMPERGACWIVGEEGASCNDACSAIGLEFRSVGPPGYNADKLPVMVPRILAASNIMAPSLKIQHPWGAFECLVREEERFHLADWLQDQDPTWRYEICSLACPCAPELTPPSMLWALRSVPEFSMEL
eukprot:TRINITY_DN63981_c0_g1_i1.p1 TRINITY_DN63981_c0_g1~~TRINITY_DN63981_c0_g1_i1.p1  ORF type:complete len:347 (-),score=51.03 TRINITY_DN63981_c0_g1_i1:269-1237(-)